MFDDIALFVHIVRCRSLAHAAKELNIPAATLTRRLQKLEQTLACQLIHRSARQFVLTQEGETYYQAYADLVEQFEVTKHNLSTQQSDMSGKLKVLAPTNISIGFLQPMWSGFIEQHSELQLELQLNNQVEDLLSSQADLALRIGPQVDSSLYQQKLGSVPTVMVASQAYRQAHGLPETLEDLFAHQLIGHTHSIMWQLTNKITEKKQVMYPKFRSTSNDISLLTQFVCDGLGIALLPMSQVNTQINHGVLEHILPQWQGPPRDLFVVWPSGRLLSVKAKCLRDYMKEFIGQTLRL
ncbi:LysR family transcriptional regulator [uncultured Shewanella sp.]|uniref:LysR family transcriptional regulator n=1 Tax=uncultured Shewanella sp. TaxID=173975 RepID=UPI002636FCAA|nr:LysR family transcriptional regulator [uncultured Shewanella sp.]